MLDVSDELEGVRKKVDIPLDADDKAFVPDDLLTIELATVNGREIVPLSPRNSDVYDNGTQLSPYGYIMYDNYLQLSSQSGGDLTLTYLSRSAAIDNEDQEIVLNEAYRMALVYGITAACFVEIDKLNKAQYFEAKFESEKQKRRKQLRKMAFKRMSGPLMPNPRRW